ncbi:M20/M25/M40 family metallo-hydrolase [Sphingomonas arenae]|uniref:M20/M25/M40 family metallo-hydrolase n=1 Tax=Sphingomonas arenae TaxID=2812555 RepID=UPI0019674FC8|nr:M20/M25/M40 family metallo-hydrolase [Sphingomonas arenae]
MRQRSWWLIAVVIGLLLAMASTHKLTEPPRARAQNLPGQFDAGRAKARLARVLGDESPHPADTVTSDGVRARLVAQLRAMGLQPRVDDRFNCNVLFKQRGVACARVRNVLVTLGPARGRHLLINSHYDSVPVGPGAADAGVGVATMMEVAGLLKEQRLARPVTFLFNEGEELGLNGARAFLDGDPLAARVDSLINLEARGVRGPVNMFETSVPNVAAVRVFAAAVDRPVANSLAVSAYRQLPNYTDVNSFEERGWLTLNLAPMGNETRYHSPGDNLQALDLSTLQHMGDQTLALASRLAAGAAPTQVQGELLFMDVAGRALVTLPMAAGVALLAGLALLLLVVTWKRRAWLGLPLIIAALLLGIGLAWAGLTVVGGFRSGQFWRASPQWTEAAIYAGVIAAGLLALAAARTLEVRQLRAAFWLLFLVVGAGTALAAPGGLIYFLSPPLIVACGMLAGRWWKPAETLAAILAALLLFVTLGAMLGLLEELLNGGPLWAFAPLGGLVLLPWLIEAKPLVEGSSRTRVAGGAILLAFAAWIPATIAPAYSADRQQQFTLQYVVDPSFRQPLWSIANDRAPLPASFARFGRWQLGTLPIGLRQRWIAPAPSQSGIVPPRATVVEQSPVPGRARRLRFRLSTGGADSVTIMAPEQADVRAAGLAGETRPIRAEGTKGSYTLSCTGRRCDGALLEMVVGTAPVQLTLIGTQWRLPPAAAPLLAAKPANAQPQYLPHATIVVERMRI